MFIFPQLDPVALQLGPIGIRWYGLAYVVALVLGLQVCKWLAKKHPAKGITPDVMESLFLWVTLGVILGGRIGYILFYGGSHYLWHPLDILKVWEGGMSFHGGAAGVIIAMFWFARKYKLNAFDIADRVVPAVPIGLFLGRIANFINGELIGRPTDATLPWSMIFPQIDLLPRHPSTLYESGLEGLVLGAVLAAIVLQKKLPRYLTSGVFLAGYGLARFIVEFYRTPEITHQWGPIVLTQGQLLCLPMLAVGAILIYLALCGSPAARRSR